MSAESEEGLRFLTVPSFELESGEVLEEVRQAFSLLGTLDAGRKNLVLLFHSLTGNTDAASWWEGVVGPGLAIDTDRFAVLCPNLLGSCYGTTFRRRPGAAGPRPTVTTRDQARLVALVMDELGVASAAFVSGGSLGGMVTLEFAATFPDRARAAVAFASPAVQSRPTPKSEFATGSRCLKIDEQFSQLEVYENIITCRGFAACSDSIIRTPSRPVFEPPDGFPVAANLQKRIPVIFTPSALRASVSRFARA